MLGSWHRTCHSLDIALEKTTGIFRLLVSCCDCSTITVKYGPCSLQTGTGIRPLRASAVRHQIYASKLKLHPVVVICVLYMAEHLMGVQGLIIAVPCAVYVINNLILGNTDGNDGKKGELNPLELQRT